MEVRIWYNTQEGNYSLTLRNLKPRRYMCGWDFDRMLKYISNELYWENIETDSVNCIEIHNKQEQWMQVIERGE